MNKSIIAAVIASGFLTACVVTPMDVTRPVPYVAVQDEYIPPAEFVIGSPVYYESLPGVAFYPMFIDTPGSCHCVVPMRFYRNNWLSVDGEVIYRGRFPYIPASRIEPRHLDVWRHSEGIVHGMHPVRGSFLIDGGHVRPMPPAGSIHHQAIAGNRVNYNPVATSYPAQNPQRNDGRRFAAPPGQERGEPRSMPVDAAAQNPQRNDGRRFAAPPGQERGEPRSMPVDAAAQNPQRNDGHRFGAQPGQERGEQKPAEVAAPQGLAKPQQAAPQQQVNQQQAEQRQRPQHEHKLCSDQDRKEEKCK